MIARTGRFAGRGWVWALVVLAAMSAAMVVTIIVVGPEAELPKDVTVEVLGHVPPVAP